MSVLIRGMQMPKTGRYFVAVDNTDGKDKTVVSVMSEFERGDKTRPLLAVHEIAPVPPHGRLIDAAALKHSLCVECELYPSKCLKGDCDWDCIWHIDHAPTIIPAEEGET